MKNSSMVIAAMVLMAGCGASPEPEAGNTPQPETAAPTATPTAIPMTELASVTIGPYTVQPMFEEKLEDGHFNIKVSGGEVAAIREWVGSEDASGVVVVKTEIENDYHHGHVEMPSPIPADARLWIEIETPAGDRLKGSVPLR
ncbi:MAG: hypothetical protein JNK74_19760 [Candidatus Hydrogenedentes bacterium]|nr:hypothetical protein [Candidatus Hydrogenedentota bacterium]